MLVDEKSKLVLQDEGVVQIDPFRVERGEQEWKDPVSAFVQIVKPFPRTNTVRPLGFIMVSCRSTGFVNPETRDFVVFPRSLHCFHEFAGSLFKA